MRKRTSVLSAMLACGIAISGCQRSSLLMPPVPSGYGSSAPHLTTNSAGEIVLSYIEQVNDSMELRYSVLESTRWSAPKTVAAGNNWFLSWADSPAVVPITDSLWAAHWRVNSASGALSYNAAMSLSRDGGATWDPTAIINTDITPTEHGFVSLFSIDEQIGAIWLDGRAYASRKTSDSPAGAQLRAVTLSDTGVRGEEAVIDSLVCDCCQTDASVGEDGPVIVYRNRTEAEIRDISYARYINGQWSEGRAIANDGWVINGCPINGPTIDADGERLAIAWYSAAPTPRVQVIFSDDSGESFTNPIRVSSRVPLGRVDVVLLPAGSAAISWLEQGSGNLMVQLASAEGLTSSAIDVSTIETGRNAGFPHMAYADGRLVFAWTDVSAPRSRVRAKWLPLKKVEDQPPRASST